MILIANAENRGLLETDLAEMHRQRKRVFLDRAGWKLPAIADLEVDRYDRQDTVYLLAKEAMDGPLLASARLLTTLTPHLMGDLFASACTDGVPTGPTTWEASRFCTAPEISGRNRRLQLLWEIICGVVETALLYGIDVVIFAANRSLLPLALDCGWDARILGPTLRDDADEITAVAAAVTPEGLRKVREKYRIPAPVTRYPIEARRLSCIPADDNPTNQCDRKSD